MKHTARLLENNDGTVPTLMIELPEFSLDIVRAMWYSYTQLQTSIFYAPISLSNAKELDTYKCDSCCSQWKLAGGEMLYRLEDVNCQTSGLLMRNDVERDFSLLYKWECMKCMGPVLNSM